MTSGAVAYAALVHIWCVVGRFPCSVCSSRVPGSQISQPASSTSIVIKNSCVRSSYMHNERVWNIKHGLVRSFAVRAQLCTGNCLAKSVNRVIKSEIEIRYKS